jgi:general L-amino acid transport system permease protein
VTIAAEMAPPFRRASRLAKFREEYAGTPASAALTVLLVGGAAYVLWRLLRWAVLDATFAGDAVDACREHVGACWSVIALRYRLILFGLYPFEDQWRAAVGGLIALATVICACIPWFWRASHMLAVWVGGLLLFFLIVRGGVFGLDYVPTSDWGGLTLTLFVYLSVIACGLPLAIVIALILHDGAGMLVRLVRFVVDATRSLPLVTILFAAVVVLPFVVSSELIGEKIYRVIIGFAFFFACYQSENIRAGLQSVPKGQREAGKALGLGYWLITGRIVLPQAFAAAMPATINQFVVTFKETSLIAIVGMFDLMASAQAAYTTGELQPYHKEVLLFIAAIYFAGAFSLGRYGAFLERRMATGR